MDMADTKKQAASFTVGDAMEKITAVSGAAR
jgi:hypothetical protein